MRVAVVLPHPPRSSETFVVHELRALMRRPGLTVTVLYARPSGQRVIAPVAGRRRRTGRRELPSLKMTDRITKLQARYSARLLARMLPANSVDIVHAQFLNFPAEVAVELGRELSVPVTALGHAADYLLQRRERLARTLDALDHVFAISRRAVDDLVATGARRVSTSVLRAATDPDLWGRDHVGSHIGARPVIVTVARLVEKKGIDDCLSAARSLQAAGQAYIWYVVGDGPLLSELHRRVLLERIDGLRLVGAMEHEAALSLIEQADLAVLPCRRARNGDVDGIPVFLLEAAALGVPVITTPVGGIADLVPDDHPGLVDPGDVPSLVQRVKAFLADEGLRHRAVSALQERYGSEFAPMVQVDRYVEVWRGLADRRAEESSVEVSRKGAMT